MNNKKPTSKPEKGSKSVNVDALLKKAASKSPGSAKRKDEKPTINLKELHDPIQEFLEAYKNLKDAGAQMSSAEALILPVAELERLKFCTEEGKFESTVKFQAPSGTIAVSVQNKYSKIDPEHEGALREVYGDESYERFFALKTEVTLNEPAFQDEGIIAKLVEAVGQENFERYFKVKQFIGVNEAYHETRAVNSEIQAQHEEAVTSGLVRCNKASCRPA